MIKEKFKEKIRCIFCRLNEKDGEEHQLTDEHVIPQVLGGWLSIPFVCKTCNNDYLGRKIESKLKKNGYIVTALDKLEIQPKKLAYGEAKLYLDFPLSGELKATFNPKGKPEYYSQKIEDGSIIVPEEKAKDLLKKQIERWEKKTGKKVDFNISDYNDLPYNIAIPIYGTDIVFIKLKNQKPVLKISGLSEPIPFRVPAKIAFEHLSGLNYPFIFKEEFDPIRKWILNNGENKNVLINNPLRKVKPYELKYLPYHYIKFEYGNGGLSAVVSLFGVLKFSVFLCALSSLQDFINNDILEYYYVYDLKNKTLFPAIPPSDVVENDKMLISTVTKWGLYHMNNESSKK